MTKEKRLRLTKRILRGLGMVHRRAISDMETFSHEGYRVHGMNRAQWNEYQDAIVWLGQLIAEKGDG